MAVHDWTRVSAGTFHHFHTSWISELCRTLNGGLLPADYYVLAEQLAGEIGPDVPTLHSARTTRSEESRHDGLMAVAEAPPQVSITATAEEADAYARKRHTLVIRHASGDDIVAMIEVLSPGNKDRKKSLDRFLDKAVSAIVAHYHLLLVDLFPPGPYDPAGIHGSLWAEFDAEPYQPPAGKPLTLASYSAGAVPRAYVEPLSVGSQLPEMPLFLEEDWYVRVPMDGTYNEAYQSVPRRWQRVIEAGDA